MITAISSSKEKSLNINKNNYTKQYINTPINPASINRIAFKGNLTKVGKNLLGDVGNNLGKKFTRLSEESLDSIKNIIRKITKENDLPFTTKSLIAATAGDESIISKALKLLADPQVPESNKSVIRDKLAELRVMQKTPQNLTPNSATNLDLANMKAEWAKNDVIKLAGDSEAAIEKAGHSVGYGDVDPKTGKLTYGGQQKVNHPNKSLHHHEDFDNNTDNLNNHHDRTSFGSDGNSPEHTNMDDFINNSHNAGAVDSIPNTHEIGTDLSYENLNFNGSGSQALEHSTNALNHLSDLAEKHDIVSDALDGVSDVAEKVADIPGAELAGGIFLGVKFAPAIKAALDGDFEKAGVKTFTRAVDTLLVPVKWGKSVVVGTLKGISLKAKHIKSESTGVLKGINNELKKWTKGRNNIEDEMLGVEKLTPQERFERMQAEKQKVLDKVKETIQTEANKQDDIIAQTQNSEVGKLNTKIEQAEETTRIAKKKTSFYQKQAAEAQALVADDINAAKARLNNLLAERDQLSQARQESLNEITAKIEAAKKESNKTLQQKLEKKLHEAETNYNLKLQNITANITKVTQLVEVYEKLASKAKLKGLKRIAGYNEQKNTLLSKFAEAIKKEKLGESVDIPNAVLFYGPKGNGKTTLTAALADHLDCDIVKLQNSLIPEEDLNNLKAAAEKAKAKFLRDGTRTIISIDEFDYFADKSNPLNSELETFVSNLSKDYHCTIFATTNNPQDIGQQLLKGNLFDKIPLGPANKENTAEILKYYADDFTNPSVNYNELAEQIITRSQSEAYSNSRLAGIVTDLVTNEKNLGKKLSQKDLQDAIVNSVPDIGTENLKLFNEQVQYCNKLTTDKSSHLHKPTKVTKQPQVVEAVKPATIDEQANKAYVQYAHKLATELKMEGKESLIRDALPDLMSLKNNDDALKAVLGHINLQNKDFVVKTAVPAILHNSEALDLGKAMSATLKAVSPDTIDCLDKLAANANRFKIRSQVDSINLLKSLTKENKKFAIEELFPYLAENMEKYKIRQSGIMGKFLDVVTPQNKDFILGEALPVLLKNADALNIDITDALKITKHLNQNNLKNVQTIADNIENLHLKDADGFLDVEKFVKALPAEEYIKSADVNPAITLSTKVHNPKVATIDEQANQAYAQYAHKLATELKMVEKEALIRQVLPDLMALKNNDGVLNAVLEHITPQNKDFVVKAAVPAILRNSDALDLGKAMKMALKSVSPDTIDCLDRLAVNAQRFKIKSQGDSLNLLGALTKDNKEFAFNDLFPYLAENMDKYKIRQSGIMGKFLEVITPENKDFVLNEALPTLLKNSEALNIDITDALKITKHLNKNNLKNIQQIVDNIEKLDLKDADGFLIVNKFVIELEK